MSIEKCIICDGCGAVVYGFTGRSDEARSKAVDDGVLIRYGGGDFCKDCEPTVKKWKAGIPEKEST